MATQHSVRKNFARTLVTCFEVVSEPVYLLQKKKRNEVSACSDGDIRDCWTSERLFSFVQGVEKCELQC